MINQEKKEWEVVYAVGQPRKIQIGIGGLESFARKELVKRYQRQTALLGEAVRISDLEEMQRDYSNYIYQPEQEPLDEVQFFQVVYALLNHIYDYILVSKAYTDFPEIAAKTLGDVLIYSDMLVGKKEVGWNPVARGRWMRLPSFCREQYTFSLYQQMKGVWLTKEFFLYGEPTGYKPIFRLSVRKFQFQKEKPLIFVIPIFLAVGGVERNTIEIMRALKDTYDFCLITLERHTKEQGSLHYQLKGICRYIFDLREISEFDSFLQILYELHDIFSPDLLWLCNNSPWFEAHTMQIRKIFADTAIVAQDVYDTKVGWIEYYKNDGPKTFDRYIAITEIIRKVFEQEYNIPSEKIDVIYPVVDEWQLQRVRKTKEPYNKLCEKYGLDSRKKHFSFIARLTEQKNPIRYLKLVHRIMEKYQRNYEFIMVGNGVLENKVEEYIKKNRMEEEMIRIPYIENIPEFMSLLDGLILTSNYEGMPIVSIEAMGIGTPILSTDVGDIKKFIVRNEIGMIFDENQSDYDNFLLFVEQLEHYKKNIESHAESLLAFFSVSNISNQYRITFDKAISDRKGKQKKINERKWMM